MKTYPEDELISAFHKSLRLGLFLNSCYFAKVIHLQIGIWKVKQYLHFIVLEDTNNLSLYEKTLNLYLKKDEEISNKELFEVIYYFCKSKKKWETEYGQDYLLLFLEVYEQIKEDKEKTHIRYINNDIFGYGSWGNLLQQYECFSKNKFKEISYTTIPDLYCLIEQAISKKDVSMIIYLSFIYFENKDKLIFEILEQFCKTNFSKKLYSLLKLTKGKYTYVFSYNILFYSFIKDLPIEKIEEYTKEIHSKNIKELKYLFANHYLDIPLYALDKHTYKGKLLLSDKVIKYNKKLLTEVDLRVSGSNSSVK